MPRCLSDRSANLLHLSPQAENGVRRICRESRLRLMLDAINFDHLLSLHRFADARPWYGRELSRPASSIEQLEFDALIAARMPSRSSLWPRRSPTSSVPSMLRTVRLT